MNLLGEIAAILGEQADLDRHRRGRRVIDII